MRTFTVPSTLHMGVALQVSFLDPYLEYTHATPVGPVIGGQVRFYALSFMSQ